MNYTIKAKDQIDYSWLKTDPFIYRGYHSFEERIPENSIPAIEKAIERKLGIVLDVCVTADSEVIIFHDTDLCRMCGITTKVSEIRSALLDNYKLIGTKEEIPLLRKVLKLIDGKVPVIILIGEQNNVRNTLHIICNTLIRYKGPIAIQSPDPFILKWFAKNAPAFIRGQLQLPAIKPNQSTLSKYLYQSYIRYRVGNPHYYCLDFAQTVPKYIQQLKENNVNLLAWKVPDGDYQKEQFEIFDNIILDGNRAQNLP